MSMISTVFQSDDLLPEHRLARFDEFQVESRHPMRVRSDEPARFHAVARSLDLADVNVVELSCAPSEVWRTTRLIRQFDPDVYSILFPIRGRLTVVQAGREAALSDLDFALYDSRHPLRIGIEADDDRAKLVRVQVPRTALPLPAQRLESVLAVPLPGRDGVGALLTQFLTRLTVDSCSYQAADLPRLGGAAVELLGAAIAHHVDAAVPEDSGRRVLMTRIEAFVRRHLHDQELTPRSIAAAHHISVGYLHRLFEPRGATVAAWIRGQRLDRARRDLADPALRLVPVHRIAARWGFGDHSTFTRAFRAAYGIPPRDYRHVAAASADMAAGD
jgi:AraC-like DNA-binding protein